jgi:penicillin-binding protein 2
MMFRRVRRKDKYQVIEPDEILIDAANLPSFDTTRLEGKIEKPIERKTFRGFLALFGILFIAASAQLGNLQIVGYDTFASRSEANRLEHEVILSERGLITDRNDVPLAENVPGDAGVPTRKYPLGVSAAQIVGYVTYPKRDQNGYWYQDHTEGVVGIENLRNAELAGTNGLKISETDAQGGVVSGSIVRNAVAGSDVQLSIDSALQRELFDEVRKRSEESKWKGGAGAIMDIETGELMALASYPSFDPEIMSSGVPKEKVESALRDPRSPFLDRAISGLYAPGSVVKPFVAVAALEEQVISPEKKILSTGSISVPNPYDPKKPSIFKDWKAHGWVDMRHAIAVSSDVYFYEVGGGFEDQPGLGIAAIERYMRLFGIGRETGISLEGEENGTIPNPEWKAENFDGERWFLGDTYHTAIGQYGFQVTLLQLVRAVAAIANGGTLVTPVIEHTVATVKTSLGLSAQNLEIVREGMRQAVQEGTAQSLSMPGVHAAGKTGTAEVGVYKEATNSLVIGFFPYENPKYAFAVVMERAPAGTLQGAPAVMHNVLSWIVENIPAMVRVDS